MKKTLALTALLTSTLLNAHNAHNAHNRSNFFNHHPIFNDTFWHDFERQFQRLDRQMDRLQRSSNAISTSSSQYFDKDTNSYVAKVKTSGIDKENFNISTHKNRLIIKAKQSSKSNNRSSSSHFSQVVSIPMDGDTENIKAAFKDGVLTISIPKLDKPKPQIRKITIQ